MKTLLVHSFWSTVQKKCVPFYDRQPTVSERWSQVCVSHQDVLWCVVRLPMCVSFAVYCILLCLLFITVKCFWVFFIYLRRSV